MSKRTRNLLIALAVILIIFIVLILILSKGQPEITPPISGPTPDQTGGQVTDQPIADLPNVFQNPNPTVNDNPVEQKLMEASRNFAERYGSFSSDNNYQNLKEVKVFASAKMSKEIDRQIASGSVGGDFYGVTSKVLTTKILSLNEASGDAEVSLTLQRSEERQGQGSKVYYQDLKLNLISSGANWLVDSAAWQ